MKSWIIASAFVASAFLGFANTAVAGPKVLVRETRVVQKDLCTGEECVVAEKCHRALFQGRMGLLARFCRPKCTCETK